MSEIPPPFEPSQEPPKPGPTQIDYKSQPPSKKVCAGLGVLLFIGTSLLGIVAMPICVMGFAAAIASLFFKGYRCIFVGYILTLGVLLLGAVIVCSIDPPDFR